MRRKKKKERHFSSRSPTNRQSKRIGARDKVGPCNVSYAWVPKTAGFVVFQNVGVSPTLIISCLVAMSRPFWFNSNLKVVFTDDQGPDPVFRDINS